MGKQAVAILVHKDALQVNLLAGVLKSDFDVFVHIDKKSTIEKQDIAAHHVFKEFNVNWGGFDMVEATMFLYRKILETNIAYTHVILLSGDALPVKTNAAIRQMLDANSGVSFLENNRATGNYLLRRSLFWYKEPYRKKLSPIEKLSHPLWVIRWFQKKLNLKRSVRGFERVGSQWTILALEHVRHILAHARFSDYRFVAIPDESLVQNHFTNNNIEHRENLIYVHWPENRSYSPDFIDEKTFESLLDTPYLFARKFESVADWQLKYFEKGSSAALGSGQ